MCLVGPPGVGKSSLAKSIAEALNKEFVKISLGGVHDESELRGHRKTYVGAMPGRIIKGMKKAGVINPLILLDEIDKMASDQKGDPASAMLEILDPEQNAMFNDNYIEENYDLSNVLFVCTANYPNNIPYALYDRLEIIDISSYTEIEKLNIAKKHIIPRVLKNSSILEGEMTFEDDAILSIIQHYSREAGVRELDRLIQKIVRKYIVQEQRGTVKNVVITPANVKDYLGKIIYDHTIKDKFPVPGVVNGMAVTSVGGELLPIEVSVMKGKGKIVITGNLEKTMNESAQVALGYVRAHSKEFGINEIN
jgi:ATP-dependent Lon protease